MQPATDVLHKEFAIAALHQIKPIVAWRAQHCR